MSTSKHQKNSNATSAGRRLSADDWILGALTLWAERGLSGVTIPALAERLGVTKGSFYWHFEDHRTLIRRALELWAERSTKETIAVLSSIEGPQARLTALLETAFDGLEFLRMEAAILAAGLAGDAEVRDFYAQVHEQRVRFVTRIFVDLGLPRPLAKTRALATMGAYLGTLQLALMKAPGMRSAAELRALRNVMQQLLAPPDFL